MEKSKMFIKVTFICGILLFLLELGGFLIFSGKYKEYLGNFLSVTGPTMPLFILQLFFIDIIIAFFIIVIFDSIYKSLPGGFLRKSINFAFILWILQTIPFLLHFAISTKFKMDLFFLIFIKYFLINTILAFVITGIYDEFYLKTKNKDEKNKEEEKSNENNNPVAHAD